MVKTTNQSILASPNWCFSVANHRSVPSGPKRSVSDQWILEADSSRSGQQLSGRQEPLGQIRNDGDNNKI